MRRVNIPNLRTYRCSVCGDRYTTETVQPERACACPDCIVRAALREQHAARLRPATPAPATRHE